MAISTHTRMAIMAILMKLAIVAGRNMAIDMVNMGDKSKNWQNVDNLRKQIGKNRIC